MKHEATLKVVGVVSHISPPMGVGNNNKILAKCRVTVTRGQGEREKSNIFFVNFWDDASENIHRINDGGLYELEGYFEIQNRKNKAGQWQSSPVMSNPSVTPVGISSQPNDPPDEEIPF